MRRLSFAAVTALLALGAAPAPLVDSARLADAMPALKLSEYRFFADGRGRVPAPGLTRYTLNTPLFSDYAEKLRYVWLPPGTKATYTAKGVLDFPVGTAIVKSFAFPADFRAPAKDLRIVETRLLVRRASGWVPLSYVWNADGSDAELKRTGARIPVSFIDAAGQRRDLDYAVPNVNQCKQCHQQSGAVTPIGPTAGNLNGGLDGHGASQLLAWAQAGRLDQVPADAPRLARWDDTAAPLAARARAYLDVNCGHCHSPAGFASNSGLYLQHDEVSPAHQGIYKRPVAAGRASGTAEFSIKPGDPDGSILVSRMASIEPGVMMPQFGRTVVHEEGLALLRRYVASLPQ
ncbi:hypothetical protein IP88_00870 [alpha proteobacterium AAP81b]|nr:hypothetical protein IP88_00870 [alpha proteobacterium AAP81b]